MKVEFKQFGLKGCIYAFLFFFLFSGTQIYGQKLLKAFNKRDYEKFVSLIKSKPSLVYEKDYYGNNIVTNLCIDEDSSAYHYLNAILDNCPSYNLDVVDDKELTPLVCSIFGHINNFRTPDLV